MWPETQSTQTDVKEREPVQKEGHTVCQPEWYFLPFRVGLYTLLCICSYPLANIVQVLLITKSETRDLFLGKLIDANRPGSKAIIQGIFSQIAGEVNCSLLRNLNIYGVRYWTSNIYRVRMSQ
jgi:hypothetical protein